MTQEPLIHESKTRVFELSDCDNWPMLISPKNCQWSCVSSLSRGGGCLLLCGRVLTRALQYKGRCNALWYAWFLCQRVLRTWADAGRWHWLGTGGWGRMTHPMIDLWSHGFGVSSTSNAIVYAFDSQEFSLLKFKHRNITCHRKISRNLIPFYSKWLISQ